MDLITTMGGLSIESGCKYSLALLDRFVDIIRARINNRGRLKKQSWVDELAIVISRHHSFAGIPTCYTTSGDAGTNAVKNYLVFDKLPTVYKIVAIVLETKEILKDEIPDEFKLPEGKTCLVPVLDEKLEIVSTDGSVFGIYLTKLVEKIGMIVPTKIVDQGTLDVVKYIVSRIMRYMSFTAMRNNTDAQLHEISKNNLLLMDAFWVNGVNNKLTDFDILATWGGKIRDYNYNYMFDLTEKFDSNDRATVVNGTIVLVGRNRDMSLVDSVRLTMDHDGLRKGYLMTRSKKEHFIEYYKGIPYRPRNSMEIPDIVRLYIFLNPNMLPQKKLNEQNMQLATVLFPILGRIIAMMEIMTTVDPQQLKRMGFDDVPEEIDYRLSREPPTHHRHNHNTKQTSRTLISGKIRFTDKYNDVNHLMDKNYELVMRLFDFDDGDLVIVGSALTSENNSKRTYTNEEYRMLCEIVGG
jgi:hypothetical protein